jgi:hypothetical protein
MRLDSAGEEDGLSRRYRWVRLPLAAPDFVTEPFVPLNYWRLRVPCNGTINGISPLSLDEFWEDVATRRTRQLWRKVAEQGWLCYYCWLPLENDRKKIRREHRVPKSKGGKEIVASCVSCDVKKGDQEWPPSDYIRLRRRVYLRELGLNAQKQCAYWRERLPNFGLDPDGKPLWAPQFGLV